MADAKTVLVSGTYDNFNSGHVRFLEEAVKLGNVHVLLWPDAARRALAGDTPKFLQDERLYLLQTNRFVTGARLLAGLDDPDSLPPVAGLTPDIWVADEASDNPQKREWSRSHQVDYRVFKKEDLGGFPVLPFPSEAEPSSRQRVLVTGCFDWFHSGHVRFFEEVSALGDLYVVVGHDANIKLLKGAGHPLFSQDERRYMVQSVRFVKAALISSAWGWMDAEPEIALLQPHIYAVNEDGDVPEKRAFCAQHGIEYRVLKRAPKEGLPRRQSTNLRGF
jgi:cytidyltransferase-like protein